MKQISRRTNPTGLNEVDRKNFTLRFADDGKSDRTFWLERFDYKSAKIPADALISCIASAGSTEQYFSMGIAGAYKTDAIAINELARDKPLRFRFVFHMPGETRLLGYADGVRPIDEPGNLGGSLVDIFPTELSGPVWLLELPSPAAEPSAKPCVLVERSIFPSAPIAVAHQWFVALVMPEVMRQIALCIASNSSALEDGDTWIGRWETYIKQLGVEGPPEDAEEGVDEWVASVVRRFTAAGQLRLQIDRIIADMQGEGE